MKISQAQIQKKVKAKQAQPQLKQILSNLDIAILKKELEPIINSSLINKVQLIKDDTYKLRIKTKQGQQNLIIVNGKAVFLTNYKYTASLASSGFEKFLSKRLSGQKIIHIKQENFDRNLYFETSDYYLILELFSTGNIIITDKEFNILSSLKKEEWKDRKISKGQIYKFPSPRATNPNSLTLDDLKQHLQSSDQDLIRALVKKINLSSAYLEQVIKQTNLNKEEPASSISPQKTKQLLENLQLFINQKTSPIIVTKDNKPFSAKPFVTDETDFDQTQSFNDAVDAYYSLNILSSKKKVSKKQEEKMKKLSAQLKQQETAIAKFNKQIEDSRAKAELIYSNYQEIDELLKTVQAAKKKLTWEEIFDKLKTGKKSKKGITSKISSFDKKNLEITLDL